MNIGCTRQILVLNLLLEGSVECWSFRLGKIHFEVQEHKIGWDLDLAELIITRFDGQVDGICLSGIQKEIGFGKQRAPHPAYIKLLRSARKSPLYLADDVRDVLSDWTIKRALRSTPNLFKDRKVLFHCSIVSHALESIIEAGGRVEGADPIAISHLPLILKGEAQLQLYQKCIQKVSSFLMTRKSRTDLKNLSGPAWTRLAHGIRQSDVFVTFNNLIQTLPDLTPLRGKIVIIDRLTPEIEQKLEVADPALILKLVPDHPEAQSDEFRHFSVLSAVVDQMRIVDQSNAPLNEYLLNWFSRTGVAPQTPRKTRSLVKKCAFIVHALSEHDLWKTPGLRTFSGAPILLRKGIERGLAELPAFYYGQVRGTVSESTGERVDCDIYALPMTPKALMKANPDAVYEKLLKCVDQARARGACMVGLGAYTKVIGDAGATVARRATLPVTNGNSYSAATTLWAARVAVEKMNLIPRARLGEGLRAKAMIIGATGGIGRVSALLLSLVFSEVVLAATRVDKLLELQDEVKTFAPDVKVRITTLASQEASDCDLIVLATSNTSGSVLDIQEVKPGAVICDCSRPLDIKPEEALKRPDVLVIESGEVLLPGSPEVTCDIGLPPPMVYACLAETVLLTLEGRYESFSLSKTLSMDRVKEIYKLGLKHGAQLSVINGPLGLASEEMIRKTRDLALLRLPTWKDEMNLSASSFAPSLGRGETFLPAEFM